MDNKNKTTLTVLAILTLLVALFGATFAYFSATSKSKPQVITTSSLSISVTLKNSTHIANIKPTTWTSLVAAESNEDISKIPFTVTAPAGVKAVYSIKMETTIPTNTTLTGGDPTDFKYKLFKVGESTPIKEGSLSSNFSENIITNAPINKDVILNDEYILYVYIENKQELQNSLQNINFSIKLLGNADQVE